MFSVQPHPILNVFLSSQLDFIKTKLERGTLLSQPLDYQLIIFDFLISNFCSYALSLKLMTSPDSYLSHIFDSLGNQTVYGNKFFPQTVVLTFDFWEWKKFIVDISQEPLSIVPRMFMNCESTTDLYWGIYTFGSSIWLPPLLYFRRPWAPTDLRIID